MDRTLWSASWSITALMSVSRITRVLRRSTLQLRPPMVPCVWNSWSTVEQMSTYRYVRPRPTIADNEADVDRWQKGDYQYCVVRTYTKQIICAVSLESWWKEPSSPNSSPRTIHSLSDAHPKWYLNLNYIANLHLEADHYKYSDCFDTGGEIDCVDKDGNTPLHIAARYGHELLINTLITSGADCTRWESLVTILVNHHHHHCLLFVTHCVLLCRRGVHSMFPLHLAALNAHADCCRKLLSSGTDSPPNRMHYIQLDTLHKDA